MVIVDYSVRFEKKFRKLDNSFKRKVEKQVVKIIENPLIGKPMVSNRKGTRELYVKPFRLSYSYHVEGDLIRFLDIYHKDSQ